jgi:uncharacterized membrane protein
MRTTQVVQVSEHRIHHTMTAVLRMLTVAAGIVILLGGIVLLVRHGDRLTAFQTFAGEPASLRSVSHITADALHGHALATIQFGILLLIATPVIRVLFVGIGYAVERDWLYVAIALIVLAVLGASLIGHKL